MDLPTLKNKKTTYILFSATIWIITKDYLTQAISFLDNYKRLVDASDFVSG